MKNTEFVLQPNGLFAHWQGTKFTHLNLDFDKATEVYQQKTGMDIQIARACLEKLREPPRRCIRFFTLCNVVAAKSIPKAEEVLLKTRVVSRTPYYSDEA